MGKLYFLYTKNKYGKMEYYNTAMGTRELALILGRDEKGVKIALGRAMKKENKMIVDYIGRKYEIITEGDLNGEKPKRNNKRRS